MAGTIPLISQRREDQNGDDQRDGVDHQADVARFRVFGHGAVKRESSNGESNHVGQDDAEESAHKSDGERLRQKLEEDVAATRAQCFFNADFAGALGDRDQHDVHQADAPDAKGKRADEGEQNLKAEGNHLEMMQPIHENLQQTVRGDRWD